MCFISLFLTTDSFSSTMDSGSYVMDSASLLAPPPRFPFSMTTSRHSLPNLDPNDMVVSLLQWPISHLERIRDGIFPPWVAKPRRREKKFPHEWLSRNSERVFLHERRSREWRNSVSLWLLSHEWGNFPIPKFLQMRNNILMLKRKLERSKKDFCLLVHIYYDPQSTSFITINSCLLSSKLFILTLEKGTKLRVHLDCI